jgi:GTP cyclohydrolase IA
LQCLGEDPEREGLRKTPQRMARALISLSSGYRTDAWAVCGDALFDCPSSELVLIKDIPVFSMCEHHILPFHGKVHIAYIPSGRVLGETISLLTML